MEIWATIESQYEDTSKKHAGGKAREDLNLIFYESGIRKLDIIAPQQERKNANKFQKLKYHYQIGKIWVDAIKKVNSGDVLIIQFPVINHTLMLKNVIKKAKKKNVKIIAFIHDLEILRLSNAKSISRLEKWRMRREELDELYLFDKIVVHNNQMRKFLFDHFGILIEKMVVLQIFDYLIPGDFKPLQVDEKHMKNCIIAGNLIRDKAAYVYKLPPLPDFELYGINYEDSHVSNIHYHGSYLADELPYHLCGGFGLVWDGDEVDICSGAWGSYLKYNNPHKISLYLACGIPVVIWEKAALAGYVTSNKVGITINSLEELSQRLNDISNEQYNTLKNNAIELSKKLRTGYYTKKALNELGIECDKR